MEAIMEVVSSVGRRMCLFTCPKGNLTFITSGKEGKEGRKKKSLKLSKSCSGSECPHQSHYYYHPASCFISRSLRFPLWGKINDDSLPRGLLGLHAWFFFFFERQISFMLDRLCISDPWSVQANPGKKKKHKEFILLGEEEGVEKRRVSSRGKGFDSLNPP